MNFKYRIFKNYYNLKLKDYSYNFQNKKNILFLGRIDPKKGIENLIYSIKYLNKYIIQNNQVVIAGEGQSAYEKKLKNLTKKLQLTKIIKFVGKVEFENKNDLILSSKVLVLPSYSENFGLVVLESLIFSTPVITSNNTPWGILNRSKSGYCVNNDPRNLAKYINTIFDLKMNEYKTMCNNANQLSKVYDINKSIYKYNNLIKEYYE